MNDKLVASYQEFECDHESLPLFQTTNAFPTVEEAGLSARTTEEANKAVEEVLASQRLVSARENHKRMYTTSFTPEICAICCGKWQ